MYVVSGISQLAMASYSEDKYGVVQRVSTHRSRVVCLTLFVIYTLHRHCLRFSVLLLGCLRCSVCVCVLVLAAKYIFCRSWTGM